MKRFISYGSIEQFRSVIRGVSSVAQYAGEDENGDPIYDCSIPLPTIKVIATEKIHGTNAAVCFSNKDGFWAQSRKKIITPLSDNAGCAVFCEEAKDAWINIIKKLAEAYSINLDENIISLYFEWAGESIQQNSALSGIERKAIIFAHFKCSPIEQSEDIDSKWYSTYIESESSWAESPENNIHNICNISNIWEFDIDFNTPQLSTNYMIKIVEEEIESNSPAGQFFGKNENVGEGIVVTFFYKDILFRFKVKGDKHSKSKVKKLAPVDEIKEQTKIEFANYACSPSRLEQAWQTVFGINNEKEEPSTKKTGDFIKAVMADIAKEELDILAEKGLSMKDISKHASTISRNWFFEQLNSGK